MDVADVIVLILTAGAAILLALGEMHCRRNAARKKELSDPARSPDSLPQHAQESAEDPVAKAKAA
jgi:hypothetical protein